MASFDKYGNVVASNGGFIGLTRKSGESDTDYLNRAEVFNSGNKAASSYNAGYVPTQNTTPTPTVASNINITPAATTQQPDITSQIDKLKQAQIDQAIAGLGKQRDQALNNINQQSAKIAPQYYQQRNAAATQNNLSSKNFAEYLAQRGLSNSGTAAQGKLAQNVALQGSIGQLNQQEQQAKDNIANSITQVQNAYANDIQAAQANAESTALQNTINELTRKAAAQQQQDQFNQQLAIQAAGLTGNYNGSQTMASRNADLQNSLALAQLTGDYNGQKTLAAQQLAEQLRQNQLANEQWLKNFGLQEGQLTGAYNNNPTLAALEAQWNKALQEGQLLGTYKGQSTMDQKKLEETINEFNQNLALEQQKLALARAKASASSSKKSSTKPPNSTTIGDAYDVVEAINAGRSIPSILAEIEQNASIDPRLDPDYLKTIAGSIPVDNWQWLPGY